MRAAKSTKAHGAVPSISKSQYAIPPSPKASAIVSSRPILSDIHPNSGRAVPLAILSMINAAVSVMAPLENDLIDHLEVGRDWRDLRRSRQTGGRYHHEHEVKQPEHRGEQHFLR